MAEDLAALLAPTSQADFFVRIYEREALHRDGAAERGRRLLSEEGLLRAALQTDPSGVTRFGVGPNTPGDPEAVRRHLEAGNPLVWDDAVGLSPQVDALCEALSQSFGALVWPNVYWTGASGSPFAMHFDPHETFIVQCAGTKMWRISTLRARLPLDGDDADEQGKRAIEAASDLARDRVACEVVTTAGDVLYLPRGLFHAATTPVGRSLHVTFGVRPPTGFELVEEGGEELRAEPLFREYLPGPAADPTGTSARIHIDRLRKRLRELGRTRGVRADLEALRARLLVQTRSG